MHSPYCVGTGSASYVKWEAFRLCVLVRALQLGVNCSNVAPRELWEPLPKPTKESFELAPRTRNRATAAITVVVADPGRAGEVGQPRSLFYERRRTREEKHIRYTGRNSPLLNYTYINKICVAPSQTAKRNAIVSHRSHFIYILS